MSVKRIVDTWHRGLARVPLAVSVALKIRNQCNAIIRYRLAVSSRIEENGEAWLARTVAGSCGTFVDIGANVGDWAELFLAHMPAKGRGICIEPSPTGVERLRARFARSDRVQVVAAAAGEVAGEVDFYDLGAAHEHSTLVTTSEVRNVVPRRVMAVRLDDILPWDRCDFLKIDTEGFDFRVMVGATVLLQQQRIGIVQFEYNDSWRFAGSTLGYALQFLQRCGYGCARLHPGRLVPIDYDRFGEYFGYSNYVAFAPSHLHLVPGSGALR